MAAPAEAAVARLKPSRRPARVQARPGHRLRAALVHRLATADDMPGGRLHDDDLVVHHDIVVAAARQSPVQPQPA